MLLWSGLCYRWGLTWGKMINFDVVWIKPEACFPTINLHQKFEICNTSDTGRMEHTSKGEKGLRPWYQSYNIFSFKNKSQLRGTIWIRRNQFISYRAWGLSCCLLLILKLEIFICLLFLPLSHGKLQLSPRETSGSGTYCVEIALQPVGLWLLVYDQHLCKCLYVYLLRIA